MNCYYVQYLKTDLLEPYVRTAVICSSSAVIYYVFCLCHLNSPSSYNSIVLFVVFMFFAVFILLVGVFIVLSYPVR